MSMWSDSRPALFVLLLATTLLSCSGMAARDAERDVCVATPIGYESWQEVATLEETPIDVDALALQLLPCLASVDPQLRDDYGYGLLTRWLRGEALTAATRMTLADSLLDVLERPQEVPTRHRSFAALILAEIMRADARSSFLTTDWRARLLDAAATALRQERDYRGLDPDEGWIHPVAHYADLLWRFTLHPALDEAQAERILAALDSQARPRQTAYRFNEGDRLARPLRLLIVRGALPERRLLAWLDGFAESVEGDWGRSFQSVAGMNELHNAKMLLRALEDQLREDEIAPALREKLEVLRDLFVGLV